ncbi:hypothetical protein D3C81_1020580 [compost metagenome]
MVGVLAVAADAAPDHRAGTGGNRRAVLAHALAVGLHVQLLQVLVEIAQVVVVGQDRVAVGAPEVAVPDAEQGQQHRHVLLEGGALEMLVHGVGAGQQLLEVAHADGQGDRQADRRPQRVAPADPVPHREDVFRGDAELDRGLAVARHGDEVAVQVRHGAALVEHPAARGLGVLQGLQGGEGFRRDDEQGGFRAQVGGHLVELAAVDVRQVVAAHAALGKRQQGLGDQLRAEEGAADADVDHIGDRLLGVAAPQAVVDALHQLGHLGEDAVHLRHHVDAVDQHLLADRAAQGGVQRRAALGGVHRRAGEQLPDRLRQLHLLGQLDQQAEGALVDQVFRIVEEQSALAQRVAAKALRVGGEGLAQVELLHVFALRAQGLPCRLLGGVQRLEVVFHRLIRCLVMAIGKRQARKVPGLSGDA